MECARPTRCALTADRFQTSSRWAVPCTGCKPDALTRCRWHGLRYAAPPDMDL
nr:MAG TPA: hypothetical protein [Caudoviricetes sp.]